MSFKRFGLMLITVYFAIWANTGSAQQSTTVVDELNNHVKAPYAISKMGSGLFGESVNLVSGKLEFVQTDLGLPGNNAIPVSVGRRLVTGTRSIDDRAFGLWDLEIPHLHGVFSSVDGWVTGTYSNKSTARCSKFGEPPIANGINGTSQWAASEFWSGNYLYIPGQGDKQILLRDPAMATPSAPSTYPLITKDLWVFSCLSSLSNDKTVGKSWGEGFLAIAPDGTKYQFDQMVDFKARTISKFLEAPALALKASAEKIKSNLSLAAQSNPTLVRKEVWILPTKITDRFGNWVAYTYDPARPANLKSITSSDNRSITFTYEPGLGGDSNRIKTVSDGTRTWTYTYRTSTSPVGGMTLDKVTLPDGSSWQFPSADNLLRDVTSLSVTDCDSPAGFDNSTNVGVLVHPSGAVGSFTLQAIKHGRFNVERQCASYVTSTGSIRELVKVPKYYYTQSLVKKTLSGPGIPTLSWDYSYIFDEPSFGPCSTSSGCVGIKRTQVSEPDGSLQKYEFGNKYQDNEGLLLKKEVVSKFGEVLQTTSFRYRPSGIGPYPNRAGETGFNIGDNDVSASFRPIDRRIVTQQGVSFQWEASTFDTFARPLIVTKSNSILSSRTERTDYFDNLSMWILGQLDSVTEMGAGTVIQKNTYFADATLKSTAAYGLVQRSMTYNADGTVAVQKDGLNQATSFSDYYRGIPRLIVFADNSKISAEVNNIGFLTSYKDAAGNITSFIPDPMGRVSQVLPPEGNSISIDFVPVSSVEKGIAAGHWRQTVSKGNSRSITYLDALWRPVLTSTYDLNDQANTEKSVLSKFDHNGNVSFQSYPQRNIASVSTVVKGTTTNYDALGRVTTTIADSELVNGQTTLTTTNEYLSGFVKKTTNPRNASTTTTFQTFDAPSESAISSISAPEGVAVQITRDIFGKTTSITRSGPGIVNNSPATVSATRTYVYDSNHRLCKTIEPEVGATIQFLDAANNVKWRASGVNAPNSTTCDHAIGITANKRASFDYDNLNRLTTTTYSDNSPGITRTYTADSLPYTVSTTGDKPTTWANTYNARRQLTNETFTVGGVNYSISRAYDANGALTSLTYPSQSGIAVVDYAPNALGEATKVGTYASNIKYHPNGAVSGFTYGNGIVHSMVQNDRGLPQQSRDVGILNDTYIYDANANVKSITDVQENLNTRNLSYDNLDRLKTATGYFGNASYDYDALDNITKSIVGTRTNIHNYNMNTNLLTSISSSGGTSYSYAYDALGNITQRGTQTYVFDAANRLQSATGKGSYEYDGLGHRFRTGYADTSTQMSLYTQAGQILFTQKVGGSNAGKTSYIYLNRHQIAEVKN